MTQTDAVMPSSATGAAGLRTPVKTTGHFVALDSWRGLCATLVAIFHIPITNFITQSDFILHSALFVDFFFVLSGFVIAANYIDRVQDTAQFKKFALLRIGRLYPLHLAIFLAYVAVELAKLAIAMSAGADSDAFQGGKPWQAIPTQLLLIHSLGMHGFETWNAPSWSISTEMFAYFVFAVLTMFGKSLRYYLYAATIVGCMFFLWFYYPEWGSANATFGAYRCLAGFFAGVFAWRIWRALNLALTAGSLTKLQWSVLEVIAVIAVIAFVSVSGRSKTAFAAPLVFSLVVIVFAFDAGRVSKMLHHKWLQFLGMLSYSIYMTHQFIIERLLNAGKVFDKITGTDFTLAGVDDFASFQFPEPLATLALIGYVGIVIGVSYLTYRFIEVPWRDRFRKLTKKKKPARETAAQSA